MSNFRNGMRLARAMSQSLCITVLLLTGGALSAQNTGPRVRNIVLVHGAWADGSGWKGVYEVLVKMATMSASSKSQRHPSKKMWLRRSAPLLYKMGLAYLSLTAMEGP
jgi:hypothetical protein